MPKKTVSFKEDTEPPKKEQEVEKEQNVGDQEGEEHEYTVDINLAYRTLSLVGILNDKNLLPSVDVRSLAVNLYV